MCHKNLITSDGEKLFLAFFEFISGEYEQSFEKTSYAAEIDGNQD